MKFTLPALLLLTLCACSHYDASSKPSGKPVKLFDGKSFTGWDGETNKTWRIVDGAFVGGSLTTTVPQNEFLATKKEYTNFVLEVEFKLLGTEGFVNAGVQVQSQRVPNHHEMIGYQCDIGEGWWGALYDESRRNKVLIKPTDAAVAQAMKRNDWNHYRIQCVGNRVQTWINDVPMIDYTETEANIPQHGRIGLQVHGGGKAEVSYRNITLRELP